MIFLSPFRIKGKCKLALPVKVIAGGREGIVAIASPWTVSGNISSMGGNFVGNQAIADIFGIGQA